jgi:hypothetical protein
MAKNNGRFRPTLTSYREVREHLRTERERVCLLEGQLERVARAAAEENGLGSQHGEELFEAKGLLLAILGEVPHQSVLTNKVRRFLGIGGTTFLPTRVQRILEDAKNVAIAKDAKALQG